jgi:hypothetical protein
MANNDRDQRVAILLDELKLIPERDSRAATRGKNRFLAEAVSLSEAQRRNWWTRNFQPGRKFATNLIASILVIAGLLFGSGATMVSAQSALPTDTLYPVKLFTEDAQLWLNNDPVTEVDLLMQQAQTRTEEITALNSQGVTPPAELTMRAQDRIEQALQVASTLDETEVPETLSQIRDRLQDQDHLLYQSQGKPCGNCEPILEQTRDMLKIHLGEVQNGLTDPQGFISHYHNQKDLPTPGPAEAPLSRTPAEVPIITKEAPGIKNPVVPSGESRTPIMDNAGSKTESTPQGSMPQVGGENIKPIWPYATQSGPGNSSGDPQPGPGGQPGGDGGGGPRP